VRVRFRFVGEGLAAWELVRGVKVGYLALELLKCPGASTRGSEVPMADGTSSAPGAESLWMGWLRMATARVVAAGEAPTPAAGAGVAPAGRAVGLPETPFTPFGEARCTRLAAQRPYRTALAEVTQAYGVAVGVTTVERMVARRATAVAALRTADAAALSPYDA